jgi:hypothetical protein
MQNNKSDGLENNKTLHPIRHTSTSLRSRLETPDFRWRFDFFFTDGSVCTFRTMIRRCMPVFSNCRRKEGARGAKKG